MPIKVGDAVLVEGWKLGEGFYILQGVAFKKQDDQVTVKVDTIWRPLGNASNHVETLTVPESHLERPIDERMSELRDDIEKMLSHFQGYKP